jgi:three-Cys-motif partner protein
MSSIKSTVWKLDPHTKAKHEILEYYLKQWFPILTKWSGRVVYLDGFAGPGIYSNGEEGSPIIALRTAVNHVLRDRFKEIVFWFIEKDKARAKKLKEVLKDRFPDLPSNMVYEVEGGEFAPSLEKTLDKLEGEGTRLAPTFAFLDPFGFSGLPMELISRMMKNPKCEVMITFMTDFINRFNDEERERALNELYGTDKWQKIRDIRDSDERTRFLIDLYQEQLMELGGANYVRSFEMISKFNKPLYHLVYGTQHWKGLKAIKEAMYRVDKTGNYRFSDRTTPSQTTMLDYGVEAVWVAKAAELIFKAYRRAPSPIPVTIIEKFVITRTPYVFRKSILRHLEEKEKIVDVKIPKRKRRTGYFPDDAVVTFGE